MPSIWRNTMAKKYVSTKEYKELGPVAYRQWRADSHCKYLHGYALTFKFEFEADTLDARNWVVDYGSLGPLKAKLEEWFDHRLLVSEDDPQLAEFKAMEEKGLAQLHILKKTGCEGIADALYEYLNTCFLKDYGYSDRVWCTRVEVREKGANMAYVTGSRGDLS
jgi:6-pyruvoyltetrahydropterin/6-carboxytetrahydropterin synthase